MRTASMVFLGVLGSWSLLACGDAPLTVNGGGSEFDAGVPMPMMSSDAAPAAMLPANCQTGGANAGNSFSDLYACYFGPMGVANCTSFSSCHVSGGSGGGFWTCGDSASACQVGMTGGNGAALTLVPPGNMTDWTMTTLYGALHSVANPSGTMPLDMSLSGAAYTFTTDDLTRIQAWAQGGAGP